MCVCVCVCARACVRACVCRTSTDYASERDRFNAQQPQQEATSSSNAGETRAAISIGGMGEWIGVRSTRPNVEGSWAGRTSSAKLLQHTIVLQSASLAEPHTRPPAQSTGKRREEGKRRDEGAEMNGSMVTAECECDDWV